MAANSRLGFLNSGNRNGWQRMKGRDASPCRILTKSSKRLLRYVRFSIFHDGGRPPSWICLPWRTVFRIWLSATMSTLFLPCYRCNRYTGSVNSVWRKPSIGGSRRQTSSTGRVASVRTCGHWCMQRSANLSLTEDVWWPGMFLFFSSALAISESIAITLLSHYTFSALFNTIPADTTVVLLGFATLNNVIVIIHALADP